ncbi:hypothetical protein [Frigidibacter sp. SD6-1]|uniref:hypothetical protein n=1 Tax=Frigidibacter sp. SD6-1 TaxID=3032581 RepID=UPI0024E001C4|nr:hypothetical protein [Frigidibacter sp. SD6-1]
MVGPSKILTVSYGTFSCTLEGFDEPFVMMKAVAEYFRDLAAEDRYFGAEPPVPDAEMLQKIAEREIHRRVEAKLGEHGVTLRQSDPVAEPAPVAAAAPLSAPMPAPAPAPAAAPEAAQPEETAPVAPAAEETAAPVPVEAALPEEAALPVEPEPAAAALPEAAQEDTPEPALEVMAEAAPAEEVPADDLIEAVADEEEADTAEIEADAISTGAAIEETAEAEAEAPLAAAPLPVAPPLPAAPEPVLEAPAPDSIAAKLMRIRAVVEGVRAAQTADIGDDDEADSEGMAAAGPQMEADFGFSLDPSDDKPELVAAEAARAAERAETAAEKTPDEAPEPIRAEALAEAPAHYLEDDETDLPPLAEDDALLSRLTALREEAQITPEEAPAKTPAPEPAPQGAAPWAPPPGFDDDEDMAEAPAEERAPEPEPTSFFQRARARVIRIGRRIGHPEEAEDHHAPAAGDDHLADAAGADEGHDVERLMEEARQKLEGAESRRKFTSISHLKAAVAATIADRKMNDGEPKASAGDEEADLDRYREDLSRAVRPHRPTSMQPTTARPAPVAPLVLVSEQRVDRPSAGGRETSIRPRRIASDVETGFDDEDHEFDGDEEISPDSVSSFTEFAEKLGAHDLTELLEAAAVYTASVEGRPYFSRPHILRKVEFASSRSDFNREDGLRSFGMLLREGKIMKISRGQFAVAEASKYMIETRRAAN